MGYFILGLLALLLTLIIILFEKNCPDYMGKSSHIPSSHSYAEIFEEYYKKASDLLDSSSLVQEYNADLLALLFVLGDISVYAINQDREKYMEEVIPIISHQCLDNDSLISFVTLRANFYVDVSNGAEVRGVWSLSDIPPSILRHPLLRCCVAFGDVITNPDFSVDYYNTPLTLHSISSQRNFQAMFTQQFYPLVKQYCTLLTNDKKGLLGSMYISANV